MSTAATGPGQVPTQYNEGGGEAAFMIAGLLAILGVAAALLIGGLGGSSKKASPVQAASGGSQVTGSSVSPVVPTQHVSGGIAAGSVTSAPQVTGSSVSSAAPSAVYNTESRDVSLPQANSSQDVTCTAGSGCWQGDLGYVSGVSAGAACGTGGTIWRVVEKDTSGSTRMSCS